MKSIASLHRSPGSSRELFTIEGSEDIPSVPSQFLAVLCVYLSHRETNPCPRTWCPMLDGPPEDTMISPKTLLQLAAYSVSLPTFAASPKLAKETVYIPSRIAALVLGRGDGSVGRAAEPLPVEPSGRQAVKP